MKLIDINDYKGRYMKMNVEKSNQKLTNDNIESKKYYMSQEAEELTKNIGEIYTIRKAEELARNILKKFGYDELIGATPIVKIARNLGFACLAVENMPENISGNIFIGGTTEQVYHSGMVIVVSSKENFGHQRFIIAHELAHYFIDYLGNKEFQNKNLLFSRTYPKENHDSYEEVRADRFAAELLMPSSSFLKQYVTAMEVSDYNIRYTISYLANFFQTKESSIKRRIDELTL